MFRITDLKSSIIFPLIVTLSFFIFSLTFNFLSIKGFYEIIPAMFYFVMMVIYFLRFSFKYNVLIIFPWFFLVSGLFIGFGSLGSFWRYENNLIFLSKMTSISYANTLNSLSILIITLLIYFFQKHIKVNRVNINFSLKYKKNNFGFTLLDIIWKIFIFLL